MTENLIGRGEWTPPPKAWPANGGPAGVDPRAVVQIVKGHYPDAAAMIESAALAAKLPIYHRGSTLCRPVREERKRWDDIVVTVAVLQDYDANALRRALDPAMRFVKRNSRGADVPCEPPPAVIGMVAGGTDKRVFPTIRGITGTPILRPDLTLFTAAGFDPATGYYLVDPPALTIPENPTRADALVALDLLLDLLNEFPFADDVSRAVALSGLITPLVRAACDVAPGHFFNAPRMGSGKSLLVDLAAGIATGERAPAILAHRNSEERDKQITAALLSGQLIVALDNLTEDIDSPVLAQVLERPSVTVRPMGTHKSTNLDNAFCCFMTGNNVGPTGDNVRRTLVGRLEPKEESPLDRVFAKPDPFGRVIAERGAFITASFTIVLAYHAAGRPRPLRPTPSYGRWDKLVREPLVWLGLPDPTQSMREAEAMDERTLQLQALIDAWPGGPGTQFTCGELIKASQETYEYNPFSAVYPGLAEALQPIARDRRGNLDTDALGKFFRSHRDMRCGGRKIARAGTTGGVGRWALC